MKPLTRYAMGTGMNIEPHMAPWPEGPYYRVDQVDARIAELEAENERLREAVRFQEGRAGLEVIARGKAEAERDAARADAERLREELKSPRIDLGKLSISLVRSKE